MPHSRAKASSSGEYTEPRMPDLHRAQRVEQTFLDGPAEWRAVGVGVVAEVAVVGIGMRIEMHHAQRPLATQGAKDRQGHQVVATDRQRQGTGGMDLAIEAFDAAQRIEQVDGINRRITEVADPHQVVGRNAADVMHLAHQAGQVTHLARAMAGTGAVGGAAVPGHADQADLQRRRVGERRQAHEGRDTGEAWNLGGVEGLRMVVRHGASPCGGKKAPGAARRSGFIPAGLAGWRQDG